MLDEKLLQLLANSKDVRKRGRSAVVRQAVLEYLKRVEHDEISQRHRKAYSRTATIEEQLEGWGEEGLKHDSAINLDHIQTVRQQQLNTYVGRLSDVKLNSVCRARGIALGCD